MNNHIKRKAVSVVIVTFNSENLIMDCLDSIFKYNDISDEYPSWFYALCH